MLMSVRCFFVIVATALCVHSEDTYFDEYVEIEGYSIENPLELTFIKIESSIDLKDNLQCRSLKTIESLKNVRVLRTDYITDLPDLEELQLSRIEEIEAGTFKNVPKLSLITIKSSFLKTIGDGVFTNLGVVTLDLRANTIEIIAPKAFDNMTKLETINLSFNKLMSWDSEWFSNTPSLSYINFKGNRIRQLHDEAFKNLKNNQVEVDLSHNKILTLGNRLFGDSKQIKYFYLSYNKIENFSDSVLEGLEKLEILALSSNKIKCFKGNLTNIFVASGTYLYHVPFECDCLKNVTEWESEHYEHHRIYWSGTYERCTGKEQPLFY